MALREGIRVIEGAAGIFAIVLAANAFQEQPDPRMKVAAAVGGAIAGVIGLSEAVSQRSVVRRILGR